LAGEPDADALPPTGYHPSNSEIRAPVALLAGDRPRAAQLERGFQNEPGRSGVLGRVGA